MLTKDLLRYRIKNGKVIPLLINVDSKDLQLLAKQLLAEYDLEKNIARNKLNKNLDPILNTCGDIKLSKGINKILQDKSEFVSISNEKIIEERAKLFYDASKTIENNDNIIDYKTYQKIIFSENSFFNNRRAIYSDLPENDILHNIKINKNPISLLQRYNCTLIQSLLIYSQQLKLNIQIPEPKEMRKFLRYLKFFRLMASIKCENKKSFSMNIDGPLSVLENSQKYGLQLASFFPVICFLKNWKLTAELKLKNKLYKLSLSNIDNIKSHWRKLSSYIPEEFSLFEKLFNEKSKEWKIIESKDFINYGKQNIIFPDYTFKNRGNKIVHLELFHRWHYSQLINRLSDFKKFNNNSYFIGIDRAVYKKKDIKELLDNTSCVADKFFLYNDFPGVNNTLKVLDKF